MLFIVTILIAGGVGLIYKFRERLAFQYGRLSRPYNPTFAIPLTRMGSDQFIELSFGKVHYIYRPSSRSSSSTLNIFVHGFSIPMEIWQDVFQSLVKDNHSCLVFDLYGRGWHANPPADDIQACFRRLAFPYRATSYCVSRHSHGRSCAGTGAGSSIVCYRRRCRSTDRGRDSQRLGHGEIYSPVGLGKTQ